MLYKFLATNGQRLAFGLGVLIIVIYLISVNLGMGGFSQLSKEEQVTTGIFNFGLSAAIFLIVATAAAMLIFGVVQIVTNFGKSSKGLIGFGVLIAVFILAYATSSGEATGEIAKSVERAGGVSSTSLKFIGAGVKTSIILVLGAFGAFILAEVRNFFK